MIQWNVVALYAEKLTCVPRPIATWYSARESFVGSAEDGRVALDKRQLDASLGKGLFLALAILLDTAS